VIRRNMHGMAVKVLAALIVVIVIAYHLLRLAASQCTGAACDLYIPFSLLLPITALALAAVTGGMAAYSARGDGGGWVAILAACAVLGSIGPIVAGFLVPDNDVLVWSSTVLVLSVPTSAGLHEVMGRRARS
jgi:hypothetical protein